jgi:YidC/Oxa1 family membrane protein insertase
MDELRSRYKNDRHKQQEKLMELYRARRVNPLAGVVPLLIQIPVFVTMYRVIRYHEESFPSFTSGGLLWFSDLTRADPYFLLPILSASVLLVSTEISSKNAAPGQKRMMRLLPLVFTAFIARFPAGLLIYWVASNTFTLGQNYLIYHRDAEDGAGAEPAPVVQRNKDRRSNRKAKKRKKKR